MTDSCSFPSVWIATRSVVSASRTYHLGGDGGVRAHPYNTGHREIAVVLELYLLSRARSYGNDCSAGMEVCTVAVLLET